MGGIDTSGNACHYRHHISPKCISHNIDDVTAPPCRPGPASWQPAADCRTDRHRKANLAKLTMFSRRLDCPYGASPG
jgi:hypothetical protein